MIASCALVAGYVDIEDQAFISGGVVIHQFSRIGRLAMIGGNTRVNLDVPPYFLYSEFNVAPVGLNMVGLKRAGLVREEIAALKTAFRLLYKSGLKKDEALQRIEAEAPNEHTLHLVAFVRSSRTPRRTWVTYPDLGRSPIKATASLTWTSCSVPENTPEPT